LREFRSENKKHFSFIYSITIGYVIIRLLLDCATVCLVSTVSSLIYFNVLLLLLLLCSVCECFFSFYLCGFFVLPRRVSFSLNCARLNAGRLFTRQ
jgi:hypothetical protein